MQQPGYLEKILSKKDYKAIGRTISASIMANPKERQRRSALIRSLTLKHGSQRVKKSWVKRYARNEKAFGPYGNGGEMSPAEQAFSIAFPEAIYNHVILSHRKYSEGFQHYYRPDFCWPTLKLAVEIDGETHSRTKQRLRDERKVEVLKGLGWTVLRFSNAMVMNHIQNVKEVLESTISTLTGTLVSVSIIASSTTPNTTE